MVSDDRGQAYTLEGVLAAILVITATVYGLQAIDTRAWEDETRAETQQLQYRASDVLTVAGESGALLDAVLCYRDGRPIDGQREAAERSTFGDILNTTFDTQADQYQLSFSYLDGGSRETQVVSPNPDSADTRPPTSAVSASTMVTITDNTSVRDGNCNPIDGLNVSEVDSSYLDDASDTALYNIVEVRLTVW